MKKTCDKCHSKIVDNKCDCGDWINSEDQPRNISIFEQAIIEYNRLNPDDDDYILFGDHHTGTCIMFFKGDYKECMNVKKFIEDYKKNTKDEKK